MRVFHGILQRKELTMSDQRMSQRRNVLFYLEIQDQESGKEIARLGDISEDGLMLLSPKKIPVQSALAIRIILPSSKDFYKKHIDCNVEVRWVKPDVNPSLFCIGCRTVDLSEPDKEIVDRLIALYGFGGGKKSPKYP
jgi:hypothetical protein